MTAAWASEATGSDSVARVEPRPGGTTRSRGRVPYAEASRVLLRDSILDGMRDLTARKGIPAAIAYALQRLLPAENVGAFVYDKRGTGGSAGKYTQDFDTLADDAVAAMREAKRIAGTRCARIGYQGGSQGGWVAPIAATRAPVDFVIVSFGLAVSVIDEDQEEVALEMRLKGHNQEEISKALEVASAAEAVFESGFTKGFERFDAVRAKVPQGALVQGSAWQLYVFYFAVHPCRTA